MKNKITIAISILIIIGIMVVLMISLLDNKQRISGDSLQFKEEYEILNGKYYNDNDQTVSEIKIERENPFIYVNDSDVIDKLTKGTHLLFFGSPECEWSRKVVPVLTTFANQNKIETIYYYSVTNSKESNNTYDKIIKIIKEFDNTYNEIKTPIVFFIKDGKIIGSHYKLVSSYKDYNVELTKEQTEELLNILQNNYQQLFINICEQEEC